MYLDIYVDDFAKSKMKGKEEVKCMLLMLTAKLITN